MLHRLGHTGRGGEIVNFAFMGVVAFPQLAYRRDHFAQGLAAVGGRHAIGHAVELELVGATGQAHFHAAVADHVEQGAFARHADRVPERRDDGAGAQADLVGARSQVGQQRHRAWRDGVFHGVVFADPHGAETAVLGHQGQFGQVFEQLAVADLFIPTFHVYEQRKFHDAFLGSCCRSPVESGGMTLDLRLAPVVRIAGLRPRLAVRPSCRGSTPAGWGPARGR
ncbi:hypothetical protein D3C78_378810 [compost metagenome]